MSLIMPVLFIIFRRAAIAEQTFRRIRTAQPSKLYIACDGPRNDIIGEKEQVEFTRKKILDMIDWDCETHYLFQEKNFGCAQGVYTAISWFFEHEDAGIILEDDCVPQKSFFQFAEELLLRYKNDLRIGMISGFNPQKKIITNESYFFSKYSFTWGWATWRRAWENMDISINWRNTGHSNLLLENIGYRGNGAATVKYWLKLIDEKKVSAWDYQWFFSIVVQNQLSIIPKVSLISNIGFGKYSTHTGGKTRENHSTLQELEFPMQHPYYVLPYVAFDKSVWQANNSVYHTIMRYVPFFIKNMIKKLFR